MLNRFLLIVVFVPLTIILIALAVANRAPVAFTLDPFNPGNPTLTIEVPLFFMLFAALALGIVVGGAVTWFRQGHYRKLARVRGQELQILSEGTPRQPTDKAGIPSKY
jgi:uncharacterized integral membrane protein